MTARGCLVATVLLAASAVSAQERAECDDAWWERWRSSNPRVCEIRELTLSARDGLSVNAGPNGSIGVTGERRRDVAVRARVQAWARDQAEAQRIASAVTIDSDGVLRAEGPAREGRGGWSVSFEIVTPEEIDLTLETLNGSIAVAGVGGELDLRAQNGSLSLDGVAGNVRGRTTNGGVDASLTGDTWDGDGLDLRTTNGGVRLRLPDGYSARLETRTLHGGIDIDFPVTVQGRIGRELSTTLGRGGPLVRAETTNGGVRITRGRGDLRRIE